MDQRDDFYSNPLHSVGYLCRINFRTFARALQRRTIRHGVTSGQWRFLRVLWEEDGISQRELAVLVGAKEATAVRSIRSLVNSGFVRREADAQDRRKVRVWLTPKARRLRTRLMPYVREVNELAARGISRRDLDTTRKVLASMYANLSAADPD